jgi:hypothetical protein
MTMLDFIVYLILFTACAVSAILLFKFNREVNKLHVELFNIALEKSILLQKLAEALDSLDQKPIEQTDGFLKFVTESRDYAFSFIETMQSAIEQFEKDTKEVFAKSEMSDDVKKTLEAYARLKAKTLPADIPNN